MIALDAVEKLRDAMASFPVWQAYLDRCGARPPHQVGLHLGIFVEPYLSNILDGTKTVEARFSTHRCKPFGCVEKGDVLLLKRAGGPVVGVCEVSHVWSYHLDPDSFQDLRRTFAAAMCATEDGFWDKRLRASYATLLRIERVQSIPPVPWGKRDRRGWVVLRRKTSQLTLW